MVPPNTQVAFFQHLKSHIPPHLSMVDEVSSVLGISNDSAYRRIRGEKPIELQEIQKLCAYFKASMDQLLDIKSDAYIFTGNLPDDSENNFVNWLNNVHQLLLWLNAYQNKHIYFLVKDVPPFLHFQIQELAEFKFFLWMKSILFYDSLKGVKFKIGDQRYQEYHALSRKVVELYNNLPITEIWNVESINSSLRQIEFYHHAGVFATASDVEVLYLKLEELINHIELQAELGVRFTIGQQPRPNSPEYRLFVNELILGDNTFVTKVDNVLTTFLNHSVLYFVATRDERFNKVVYQNVENLMKKSTLISRVCEKERSQFFNGLRASIHARLDAL